MIPERLLFPYEMKNLYREYINHFYGGASFISGTKWLKVRMRYPLAIRSSLSVFHSSLPGETSDRTAFTSLPQCIYVILGRNFVSVSQWIWTVWYNSGEDSFSLAPDFSFACCFFAARHKLNT